MDLQKTIGNEKLPAVLKDPFKKNNVKRIYVNYQTFWDDGKWSANGVVEFQNGDTNGEQKFKGESFDEVVMKIKTFIDNELK